METIYNICLDIVATSELHSLGFFIGAALGGWEGYFGKVALGDGVINWKLYFSICFSILAMFKVSTYF